MGGLPMANRVTVVVPALYNFLPGESVAMGWLNEIDALATIRQRINCAAKLTGWDVFTFHTLHNLDRYFDTTISAVRDTWLKERNLSIETGLETKRRFGRPYDYHRVEPRLVENLVFQSSVIDYLMRRATAVPVRLHIIGTALLSALVWSGGISFAEAVNTAVKIGNRWDSSLDVMAEEETSCHNRSCASDDLGWVRFERIRRLIEGRSKVALSVARDDLPRVNRLMRSFWYSPTGTEQPVLIETATEAEAALETLNIASWSAGWTRMSDPVVRGWLVSSLHPMARACRWSFSNFLLATPSAVSLFLDHVAVIGQEPLLVLEPPRKIGVVVKTSSGYPG
jgi:hypothetical protein